MILFPGSVAEDDLNGMDNMSGLKQQFFVARRDWFNTIARVANDMNSPTFTPLIDFEGTVEIRDSHTFKAGFGFMEVYCTFDKGSYKVDEPKNNDQNGGMHTVTGFIPGAYTNKMAFLRNAQNYNWICLVKTMQDVYLQVGIQDLWARISAGFQINNTTGDVSGFPITVKAFMASPIIYSGTITKHP